RRLEPPRRADARVPRGHLHRGGDAEPRPLGSAPGRGDRALRARRRVRGAASRRGARDPRPGDPRGARRGGGGGSALRRRVRLAARVRVRAPPVAAARLPAARPRFRGALSELPETRLSAAIDALLHRVGAAVSWIWPALLLLVTASVFLRYGLGWSFV